MPALTRKTAPAAIGAISCLALGVGVPGAHAAEQPQPPHPAGEDVTPRMSSSSWRRVHRLYRGFREC